MQYLPQKFTLKKFTLKRIQASKPEVWVLRMPEDTAHKILLKGRCSGRIISIANSDHLIWKLMSLNNFIHIICFLEQKWPYTRYKIHYISATIKDAFASSFSKFRLATQTTAEESLIRNAYWIKKLCSFLSFFYTYWRQQNKITKTS